MNLKVKMAWKDNYRNEQMSVINFEIEILIREALKRQSYLLYLSLNK
jgi:hypothetical protein